MTPESPDAARRRRFARATQQAWDVVVIGGGATGLGIALDAQTRGYAALVVDARDFAHGTSSRSTKLLHGGVRYLAQGNLTLVRAALHERALARRNAPHLSNDLGFVIPAYRWWQRPYYAAGMKAYDLLAGSLNLAPSRSLSAEATRAALPHLRSEGLIGGVRYCDGQFDDARMAVALARSIEDHGGLALNYARVVGLPRDGERIAGVDVVDAESGAACRIAARCVVNATGVFADGVRRLSQPQAKPLLAPSRGIHLVFDRRFLPAADALMVPQTADGRVLFALPWCGHLLAGTTDTAIDAIAEEPQPAAAEIDFVLSTLARYLDPAPRAQDILASFAGLRPLVGRGDGATAQLSREHAIEIDAHGLLTVVGGKWTTYRRMAENIVDRLLPQLGPRRPACATRELPLHGYATSEAPWWLRGYGADLAAVLALPGAAIRLCPAQPALPYVEAQVRHAVRAEQARHVDDVLARRLRLLHLDRAAALAAWPRVAALMAEELGRDKTWIAAECAAASAPPAAR
ncbi:MAG: glycerol-3-phosphate dehydrogenase/oxidase [Rhodocyclaceae bacterium]|nr:glycerol-3-phosphate dehydrogenase/oxidase [Rhodocyclaceae bacterium]